MLCTVYPVEYTLNPNPMIEIAPWSFDLMVIVQVLTLAFLCKNLDYKPQSTTPYPGLAPGSLWPWCWMWYTPPSLTGEDNIMVPGIC